MRDSSYSTGMKVHLFSQCHVAELRRELWSFSPKPYCIMYQGSIEHRGPA